MEARHDSTRIAGVDVGKHWLDVAVHGTEDERRFANSAAGVSELIGWLRAREVGRVGMEASGGYERRARAALDAEGLEVVLHQPLEVRRFAQLKRKRAKNDRLDARLIAAATAQVDSVKAAQDQRLASLAEQLTVYEFVSGQIAALKTLLATIEADEVAAILRRQLAGLQATKAELLASLLAKIRAQPDLRSRFRLLLSLPGVGPVVAAALLIRMPELGALKRGQAASLIGVAPFARDSGQWHGKRFIQGGRGRPRRMLYLAALAARRVSPDLRAFAQRLADRGKAPKLILVAIMRKLAEAANLVLNRQQPWLAHAQ